MVEWSQLQRCPLCGSAFLKVWPVSDGLPDIPAPAAIIRAIYYCTDDALPEGMKLTARLSGVNQTLGEGVQHRVPVAAGTAGEGIKDLLGGAGKRKAGQVRMVVVTPLAYYADAAGWNVPRLSDVLRGGDKATAPGFVMHEWCWQLLLAALLSSRGQLHRSSDPGCDLDVDGRFSSDADLLFAIAEVMRSFPADWGRMALWGDDESRLLCDDMQDRHDDKRRRPLIKRRPIR